MSDLSVPPEALQRARSQLSVSTYFDAGLHRREMELIFQHGPRYLGHELAVPEVGDYYALPQESEGRALVRTPEGVELISNVCRHRQAIMLKGRGNSRNNIQSAVRALERDGLIKTLAERPKNCWMNTKTLP